MNCDGCAAPLNPIEALHWSVCMPCTRARQKAVLSHRCCCGPKRVPGELCTVGSRRWIPCRRCLGTIRQVA
jgi:hypothetical protein